MKLNTKKELCNFYGFSPQKLATLLNVDYFKELESLGYSKNQKILSSHVVKRFLELYGVPVDTQTIENLK